MIGGTASLPKRIQRALGDAAVIMLDEYLEDLGILGRGEPCAQTVIADALPCKYLPRYNILSTKEIVVCVSNVVWKLQSPNPQELACVAEELALNAIIQQAGVNLELQDREADLDDVYEEAFQDTDFEFLFAPQFDGIEDSEMADQLRIANLRLEDWFTPFANVPYVQPYVGTPARPLRQRKR